MRNDFFTSDHHFGHDKLRGYCRPRFGSVEEMDELMIQRWNQVVGRNDRVYHGGDFMWFGKHVMQIARRLNGTIYMAVGNHDQVSQLLSSGAIKRAKLWYKFKDDGWVLTHIPLPVENFPRDCEWNLHGHTHLNMSPGQGKTHMNICVEQTAYAPIAREEMRILCPKP